jgi:hypothetical protein
LLISLPERELCIMKSPTRFRVDLTIITLMMWMNFGPSMKVNLARTSNTDMVCFIFQMANFLREISRRMLQRDSESSMILKVIR